MVDAFRRHVYKLRYFLDLIPCKRVLLWFFKTKPNQPPCIVRQLENNKEQGEIAKPTTNYFKI